MKKLIYLLVMFFFNHGFSQKNSDKTFIADTLPGWFRYQRNAHAISLMPTYTFVRNATKEDLLIKGHIPGIDIVYNYFPIKRLGLGANFAYSHYFVTPANDADQFSIAFDSKYYFFGKNKNAFYLTSSIGFQQYRYKTNTEYPWANFQGDSATGNLSVRNYPFMRFGIGVAGNIYNNMTINFHIAPTVWLDEKLKQTTYYHLGLYYYFNRKPQLPRTKIRNK